MPIQTFSTLSTLINEALAAVRTRLPGYGTDIGSFLGALQRAWAMGIFGLQRTAEAIDRESPPNQKTSDAGIIAWAEISGVPSNRGDGQYGQNAASAAEGGLGNVTGTATTVVLAGQQLVAADGVTIFELDADVTIPAVGSFSAVTEGAAGNLDAGDVLTWLTPPTGCDATVTLSSGLSGGEDLETIAHLFGRLRDRWQAPPKGGANIDYKEWAAAVDGVDEAYVYSRRGGTATVHVVITSPGSGAARIASDALIDKVQARLDSLKPTDVDECIVMAATEPSGRALTIEALAFLSPGYAWDWNDTTGTWTVVAYSAGPKTLEVDNPLPDDLKAAIDGGAKPRIQVVNTTSGAPVVIEQVRVLSYAGAVMTLENELLVAPTVGDSVYAGSYAASTAANAILAFIDSLGPSRASGFADDVTVWEAIASIWGCGDAALSVTDTDDITRMLSRLAGTNGLTIAVGAGSPATVDFEPQDTYVAAPEVARAARVIVRQATP